jgi:hypothetical protein
MMSLDERIGRRYFRSLLARPEGRAHILSLLVISEEGDEGGVFDELARRADDEDLAKVVRRHKADEERHAGLFRECLARNGLALEELPDELLIVKQVAKDTGAKPIETRTDVMNTYALLLAIEKRGVERFPVIAAAFREAGDAATADVVDQVTADECRHVKYCAAIGRRYANDDAEWSRAVATYAAVEARAFNRVRVAGIAYTLKRGLVWQSLLGRFAGWSLCAATA